ncbi:MAG TPA: tRNA (adenosine(37)-N6)-threonylcarbamoyltransferase complex dimerization subunit type 1 TsaB [Solirubrobacteraceae bacterium]|nr:tRNA (adenosine(37)-N6)-threonylcarbamoyltransferase complex dimerization subunit type 1 TsaB [Solirubrobacteraceae bacterium]
MIVLGFDTASHATAVGLRLADGSTLHARDDPAPGDHPGHATRLLSLARELLAEAGVGWDELTRLAVGLGPGRFTGLRVGIATARGLAQSLSIELVGVSSLHALALPATWEGAASSQAGESGPPPTIAVIDARRGEVFAGAYAARGDVVFAQPLRPEELLTIVEQIERLGGPVGERWRAVGDGALLHAEQLARGGVEVPDLASPLHLIDGRAICELGALAAPVGHGQAALARILPDYRRAPDAALARGAQPPTAAGVSRA